MSISLDEARRIAVEAVRPSWHDHLGTIFASFDALEDDRTWAITVAAEEWLIDEDVLYMNTDMDLVLVDKESGKAVISTYLNDPERFDAMYDVSSAPE